MDECYLYRLPNELLLHLFAPIPTPELLLYTPVSQRIHTVILRILYNRIVAAAELHSHTLLLECYHPSAKLTEPPYFCTYNGTDGLSRYEDLDPSKSYVGMLGKMHNMYSRFRPHRRDLEAGGRRVLPRPGDVPGSRTFPGTVQDKFQGETVKQMLGLEAHELFTQLVAQTNLVKIGPRNGLFTCFVGVEEGVVRVWREWLKEAAAGKVADTVAISVQETSVETRDSEVAAIGKVIAAVPIDLDDPQILWVSPAKNSGIRFNVRERRLRQDAPILIRADEDAPVNYEIEYEELIVRTSHLLLMLEESMVQEDNSSGKAVVFGSFG